MNNLFSYGTLQYEQVQKDTFGRLLKGYVEILEGYQVQDLKITDQAVIASSGTDVHPILVYTGDEEDIVKGTLFEVTDEELAHADKYEVSDYKRVELKFQSGKIGFAYVEA